MLQIQHLTYSAGGRDILRDINWTIPSGRRIALIGPNGAGKTTLLRLISGQLPPGSGQFIRPRDFSVGYLPQEEIAFGKGSILHLAMEGRRELLEIFDRIQEIHEALEEQPANNEPLIRKLGELEHQYSQLGGYELEHQAKKILSGLGFSESDFQRSIVSFSGGWRMRVYLARILLQQPDLLLLDEPTNHLDLPSLEWIENYLRTFTGSMIIVSHDRFFIDRLAQEIAELQLGRLTVYSGNYRFYEKQKALNEEQLIQRYMQQQEERQRLEKFINRFRYKATKAAQVQSRIKQLEKMEHIELPPSGKTISFKIKADSPSYKDVLHINNLWFRYDTGWVLQDINLDVYRGEKIALVGVNGAGKTTLTRLISGELQAQRGQLVLGERVHVSYYAQHQIDTLNLNKTIMEEVAATAAESFRDKLRDILGVFQFSGDDTQKTVGVLSGGEKARVSLAKIILSPCNFLIMDEPTNHLDLASKEALEQALQDYDGTLLLISHDRYFLDKLVSRVIEIDGGRLREYAGNYSFYLNRKTEQAALAANAADPQDSQASAQKKNKEQKRKEAEARNAISKERRRLQKAIDELENAIEHLEQQKAQTEQALADPAVYQNPQQAAEMNKTYRQIQEELEAKEVLWEQAHLELEELLAKLANI